MNEVTFVVRITLKGGEIPKLDGQDQADLAGNIQDAVYDYLLNAKDDENTDADITIEEEKLS